jgi:hypothetical protein
MKVRNIECKKYGEIAERGLVRKENVIWLSKKKIF